MLGGIILSEQNLLPDAKVVLNYEVDYLFLPGIPVPQNEVVVTLEGLTYTASQITGQTINVANYGLVSLSANYQVDSLDMVGLSEVRLQINRYEGNQSGILRSDAYTTATSSGNLNNSTGSFWAGYTTDPIQWILVKLIYIPDSLQQ